MKDDGAKFCSPCPQNLSSISRKFFGFSMDVKKRQFRAVLV